VEFGEEVGVGVGNKGVSRIASAVKKNQTKTTLTPTQPTIRRDKIRISFVEHFSSSGF
jgi:hypothetical protein